MTDLVSSCHAFASVEGHLTTLQQPRIILPHQPTHPPNMSLAISPNLQAMLEYEDRIRTSKNTGPGTPNSQASVYSQATKSEPAVIVGLPPPPRSKKSNNGSPRAPLLEAVRVQSSYVDDVLDISSVILGDPDSGDEEWPANPRGNPYINPAPDDSRPPSPIIFRKRTSSISPSRSSSYHASRREIDAETVSRPSMQRSSSYDASSTNPEQFHVLSLTNDEKVPGRKGRGRPEYGHNRKRSASSDLTGTTWEPMSTHSEQHISISSTHYTTSIRSLAFNSASHSRAHDSLIEISGSSQPEQSLEAWSFNYPTSSPVTSTSSVNPSTSPFAIKPPLPRTPKPTFHRPLSVHHPSRNRTLPELIPTGNHLSSQERAELIRKTRKLTQVFGQIPHAQAVTQGVETLPLNSNDQQFRRYGFLSINDSKKTDSDPWHPQEGTLYARRYSTPLTPQDFSFIIDSPKNRLHSRVSNSSRLSRGSRNNRSPVSFIELSDDEDGTDTPKAHVDRRHQLPFSHLEHGLSLESLSLEEKAEVERRRKRDKLAKLHRFLGSRVPQELALGLVPGTSLLPAAEEVEEEEEEEEEKLRFGLRRRGSSPATESFTASVNPADRLKCELDVEEKAVNVWRAAKMEKVFGTPPPQTLYHTRHASPVSNSLDSRQVESSSTSSQNIPVVRSFKFDAKGKKTKRPGTSESSQGLIPKYVNAESSKGPAEVYNSYRESLNSLGDIIDRDDKDSIEQLHEILHEAADQGRPLQAFVRWDHADILGRRRSLPLTPSISSLSSESSMNSPAPEVSSFEVKRRRAAKLTNFFGVNHRDIMNDILESIESGVQEESGNGTLDPEQVRELLQKLRKLKNKT